jgi:aryl-alcohol dehydrogenase-like predicted oxidoreductase
MENRLLRHVSIRHSDLSFAYATVGTMMFGKRADQGEAQRIVDVALDHGMTFFDTADMYQDGESERLLGKALKGRREKCVVATKVGYGKGPDGNEEGLAPDTIRWAVDRSLKNLDMEYVDVYYLHRPDYVTPVGETLAAMNELIEIGKVRHFGLSNFGAWQSADVLRICDENCWPRPAMTQMIYNVLLRQIEYEYVSFCRARGLHLTVYNPLAGGLLTGKYATLADESAGSRFVNNANYRNRYWTPRFFEGMLKLKEIADSIGMDLTHLALNWVAQKDTADSMLLGPSSANQLLDCINAGKSTIPDQAMEDIDTILLEFDGTDVSYAR